MSTFETERLFLNTFYVPDDVDEYYKIINERSIRNYLPLATAHSKNTALDLVTKYSESNLRDNFYFKIQLKKNQKIIGAILAYRSYNGTLNVSYLIGKPYRNKSFMTEALEWFIDYISETSDEFKTLTFRITNENVIASHIIRSLGAKEKVKTIDSTVWEITL